MQDSSGGFGGGDGGGHSSDHGGGQGTQRYGDPEVIRGLARLLRRQADKIEEETTHLAHKATRSPWTGVAADAMRHGVDIGTASLQRTAQLHLDAAKALDEHAAEVERLERLIAAIEHAVLAMIRDAKARLHGLVGAVGSALGDPIDEFLDRFDPPPSGHKDWLTVHLPVAVPGVSGLLAAAGAVR